jgi:TNF receptor-associated protein 1
MKEAHKFEAEIQQLLDIVVHSLYTEKEIFLRELISNAADACERLRFQQACNAAVHDPGLPLSISVVADEQAGTLTITDTGCGMTREELVRNLGTIAHSGTKAFLTSLKADAPGKPTLIGQFGVGFYSAFMAASEVIVHTRSFLPGEQPWVWHSQGLGGFEIESGEDQKRGTRIVLKLKDDARQYLREYELERILKKYSKFVPFPLELGGKRQNSVEAIWSRNRNEVSTEDYTKFYQFLGHDQEEPLYYLHFNADAPLAIQALLFVPQRSFETPGLARMESEVHLYCRKVLIQSRPKGLLPDWLRFLKGVVDSEDLPLNISRETMQDNSLVQKLNKVLTSRFLKFLEEQADKQPEKYEKFYSAFSRFIKEGIVTDFVHTNALGQLLRYESSALEPGKQTSLADYVKRMQPEQKHIYYLSAASRDIAESSPYFEVFRSRNLEVLFLYDPLDDYVMEHLHGFDSKDLISAEKAELEALNPVAQSSLSEEQGKILGQWLKETLGEQIESVKISKRLTESPAVLIDRDPYMQAGRRNLLKSMKTTNGATPFKWDLEINASHPAIAGLERARQEDVELARSVAEQILDNARIAAGLMDDPRRMLKRLNLLVERAVGGRRSSEAS